MRIPLGSRAAGGSGGGLRPRLRKATETARDPRRTLRRLFAHLRPFAAGLAGVALLIVVYTVLGLIGPYLMGVAIDRFIAGGRPAGLAGTALAMLLVYLLHHALQALSAWRMADLSQRALEGLRQRLFAHLQTLPVRFFDGRPTGELVSRLTGDIDAINQAISQNVTSLLAGLLSLVGIVVAMFALDCRLALASLPVVPLMIALTALVSRSTRQRYRELQQSTGGMNALLAETISGQKVVRAFGRGEAARDAFADGNGRLFRAAVRANRSAFLLMPLTGVLGNLFVIVLAGVGGWLALAGLVSVGTIATFIHYAQNFVHPLRQLANLYNAIQAALAGAERVFEILDTPAGEEDEGARAPGPIRGEVRFDRVSFGYRPEAPVIRGMSFEARPGETVALVGPTGAGKTTLINLLARFYEIDGGRITIDGREIRSLGKGELRRRLGIVLQETFLFSGSVIENIRYGRLEATDAECVAAAEVAGADPFIRRLPQGYRTELAERGGNLSQGQRQLLAIARVVLADPAILILDEATSSVDTRTEARIQKALLALRAGRTSFVIAHRLGTVRDADQVLVIDRGRIVERGSHRELLARRGLYRRLYESQFRGWPI